jgi:methylmalonyl-CoA mutase cobalamin-binding domain/chain
VAWADGGAVDEQKTKNLRTERRTARLAAATPPAGPAGTRSAGTHRAGDDAELRPVGGDLGVLVRDGRPAKWVSLTAADRTLVVAPLFHATGIVSQLVGFGAHGGTCVFQPRFQVTQMREALMDHRITFFAGVTAMIQLMLADRAFDPDDLPALRTVCFGGAPVAEAFGGTAAAALPGVTFANVWGLTEATSIVTCALGAEWEKRPWSVGRPVPGVEVAAAADGELCVRGPVVTAGYWHRPEATAETFTEDGWLRTGDVGRVDAEGYVQVLDRRAGVTAARSASGISLRPFYGPDEPGTYPFTRGRLRPPHAGPGGWIQRELSGEGSPRRSNQQLRSLLAHGARGIDVIGDNPTMSALDPDHPMCVPAVGTTGVSLCRKQDFTELLDGIPLDRITLSHSLPPAFAIAGQYLAAREAGLDPAVLRGSAIQPPLYSEDCSYSTFLPFGIRMRLTLDSIAFSLREMPRFHAFLEDTYYISDGGLDAVEEMSLGLLEIREVCRRLLARGLPVDAFAPRIAILVNCRMDLFEEIAKIRATRRLFARMMREEFGAADPRSWSANIAVHTSGLTLTAAQPANNIVRGAVQALAMAMAGVQGLEISTFDEPFRTPSDVAHQLAIRTQQIIESETNVGAVQDPLGGSWYLEALTDELESRIDATVRDMEQRGDVGTLVESGYFRGIFTRAMDRHSTRVQPGGRARRLGRSAGRADGTGRRGAGRPGDHRRDHRGAARGPGRARRPVRYL